MSFSGPEYTTPTGSQCGGNLLGPLLHCGLGSSAELSNAEGHPELRSTRQCGGDVG